MNGICEIRVGGKTYPLRFGMVAAEEFNKRILSNPNDNVGKMSIDIIYSGMLNHAVAKGIKVPSFDSVYDLCEGLYEEADRYAQFEYVWNCFLESKHGSKWKEVADNLKKKAEENTDQK